MGKVKILKNQWIEHEDGDLINLSSFAKIKKVDNGYFNSESSYFIEVTELVSNETYMLIEYKKEEEELRGEDFKNIREALNS